MNRWVSLLILKTSQTRAEDMQTYHELVSAKGSGNPEEGGQHLTEQAQLEEISRAP